MTALTSIRCGCDPLEVDGLIPGSRCSACRTICEPWSHQTAMVRVADARDELRTAMGIADRALLADDDGDSSRRDYMLAAAALIADRATNALAFAAASLNEEGRPATGMAGAHDQDPGRSR